MNDKNIEVEVLKEMIKGYVNSIESTRIGCY
jgi:hypothetical protein